MRPHTQNKTGDLNPNIPIITLKVNDLNKPNRRQRLAKQIKEHAQPSAVYKKPILNIVRWAGQSKRTEREMPSKR